MKRLLYVGALVVPLCMILLFALARASVPWLEGRRVLKGLETEIKIDRDELGVVTVQGASRADVARATGYLHAQDRFFQMDLMRRRAAGELSALLGKATLSLDRRNRRHRLRSVAVDVVERLEARHRRLLTAYTEGVNASLEQLPSRPFEYWILSAFPQPWKVEDSILVVHSMFLELNDEEGELEFRREFLKDCMPAQVVDFLASVDVSWAAPVDGGQLPSTPIPAVTTYNLRDEATGTPPDPELPTENSLGPPGGNSNSWAVSGRYTETGGAIVANDMHLALRLPNTWYRMRLRVQHMTSPIDVTGVTLPGVPVVVAGSNGKVGWGFTNSYGDWTDLVEVELDPEDPNRYLTSDGYQTFSTHDEPIEVKGREDVPNQVRTSVWGPVLEGPHDGPASVKWLAHEPEATNLRLIELERAQNIHDALSVASRSGLPPQNFVAGDADGHIGWTIAGRIPQRRQLNPNRPTSWASGQVGWSGWLPPNNYPRIVNPSSGYIWTANHQVVTGSALQSLGDGGYAHGARARQIRDGLFALHRASIQDMLRIQLDDRALLMARWQALLLETIEPSQGSSIHPRIREFRAVVQNWDGRASVVSAAYRLVRVFRKRVRDTVFSALTAPCRRVNADIARKGFPQEEGALWALLEEQPIHLLDPRYQSWEELLRQVARETITYFDTQFEGPFRDRTWGEHNTVTIRHPLSPALPRLLEGWLRLPPTQLPGDRDMPRFQTTSSGASERFAVEVGNEARGYFHMPGGQSGHPLAPFYQSGHRAWVDGDPLPFLPGPAKYTLKLIPAGESK